MISVENIGVFIHFSSPPIDEDKIKCPLNHCTWGLGVAGDGRCRGMGDATNPKCDKYEEDTDEEG